MKIEMQLSTTKLDHHNLQVTDYGYVEKSPHESSSKTESIGGWWDVWPEDQRIDLGTIYVCNDGIRNSSWDVFSYLFEADCWKLIRNTEFTCDDVWLLSVDENDPLPWSSDGRVHVYSDSVLCQERKSQPSEANIKWKEQIHYFHQSNGYAESSGTDNPPSSSVILSQDSHRLRFSEKFRKMRSTKTSRTVWGRYSIHVDVQRHWLDKERQFWCWYLEYQRRRWPPKSFSEGIGHSLVLEMKKSGSERATISQKDNGTSKPIKCLKYSHRLVIPSSAVQVRSAEGHWSESKHKTLFTSQRARKTLS